MIRFAPGLPGVSNTAQLGRLIYTDYIFLFQSAGLVLLVAMIGAIVLTLRDKGDSRRQVIALQIARDPAHTMVMMNVASRAGMKGVTYLRPTESQPEEAGDRSDQDHHEHVGGGTH